MSGTLDLIIKNAKLIDLDELVDIAIKDDKIVVVDQPIKKEGEQGWSM